MRMTAKTLIATSPVALCATGAMADSLHDDGAEFDAPSTARRG